jgi:acetyltransferase-like isoleucine patch superfamily enzyme
MLHPRYLRVFARLLRLRSLTAAGRRIELDGPVFLAPRVTFQIGRQGRVALGRWSWVGRATRIRCHEGRVEIGAKTVIGEECTITAYQHVSIGRECMVADRAMLIDFDHHFNDPERPIRVQGIDKHDVRVGNNVWVGYSACVLRGVTVGDNAVIGAGAVVTRDVPANAVVAGVPARVIRMRPAPRILRWG